MMTGAMVMIGNSRNVCVSEAFTSDTVGDDAFIYRPLNLFVLAAVSSLYSKHFDKRGRAEKNHSESPSSTDSTTNLDPEIRIACIHKSHLSLSHSQLPK
ncbi:unnamed protein product [Onchocerca ochengi]|uniref:Secreted protein n=1 Tax=Onchocerca ochengi TaxID=42157 RepID=A0A182EB02_ONCOC|nr:unnamed protein product [Onchocerca ochengi]